MRKLFDGEGSGGKDPREGFRFLGPRRTIKVGSQIIEQRWGAEPGISADDLLQGITRADLAGPQSGFVTWGASQGIPVQAAPTPDPRRDSEPREREFRGQPIPRGENPQFGEVPEFNENEIDLGLDDFSGAIPGIDFTRAPYDSSHDRGQSDVRESAGEDAELRRNVSDITMEEQTFRNSYTDRVHPDLDEFGLAEGSTHEARLERLREIFDDEGDSDV